MCVCAGGAGVSYSDSHWGHSLSPKAGDCNIAGVKHANTIRRTFLPTTGMQWMNTCIGSAHLYVSSSACNQLYCADFITLLASNPNLVVLPYLGIIELYCIPSQPC